MAFETVDIAGRLASRWKVGFSFVVVHHEGLVAVADAVEFTPAQQREAAEYFDAQISPALTPLVIHAAQPFPFFSNLSLSLSFRLQDPGTGEPLDARVKVPADLPKWVRLSSDIEEGAFLFVRLHEVIRENAHKLYPGMRLTAPTLFRLTRDAEVEVKEQADQGLRELVREQIRQRRYEPVVRLDFALNSDGRMRHLLAERFGLTPADVYDLPGELDYKSLFQIAALDVPELRDPPFEAVTPVRLEEAVDIFEAIRAGDLLHWMGICGFLSARQTSLDLPSAKRWIGSGHGRMTDRIIARARSSPCPLRRKS